MNDLREVIIEFTQSELKIKEGKGTTIMISYIRSQ
jgi:hypothetical protein